MQQLLNVQIALPIKKNRLALTIAAVVYIVILFDLLCTRDIYCTSVRPGRGIPPLRLFLMFLPLFFLLKGFFVGKFFFMRIEGLRTEGVVSVQIVKPSEVNCDL